MNIHIIETEHESSEGYKYQKPDRDLLDELIKSYNELATYIAERDGFVKETWGEDFTKDTTVSGGRDE